MMPIFLNQKMIYGLTVLGAAVILLLIVLGAVHSGQNSAEAALIVGNAEQIKSGLAYFYNDQERLPNSAEYQDRNVMISYFNNFPPQEFPNKTCTQTYSYQQLADNQAEIGFCLSTVLNNWRRGWNKISVSE